MKSVDWEELRLYLFWAFLAGIFLASFVWGSCTSIKPTPEVRSVTWLKKPPPRCRVLLRAATPNILVSIRRDCVQRGITTVLCVLINSRDNGNLASDDSFEILLKFFDDVPTLVPISITTTPQGYPAFLFVVVDLTAEEERQIRRDIRLRRRHP